MVDRQPSFLVLKYLWLVLGSVIITASNSKLAGAYEADISGFINIDCGALESYTDNQNGLFYEPDTKYIDTGEIKDIIPNFTNYDGSHGRQRFNLRSFPLGKRNCYTLKPNHGANNNYFIRAVFEYGNYDDNNKIPVFDLYLGVTKWTTVRRAISIKEIIHVPSADYIDVCLVNIGKGIPYISALELRPVDNSIYRIPNVALSYYVRYDIGGDIVSRYKVDVYDRLWYGLKLDGWNYTYPAGPDIYNQSSDYKVPDEVMRTSATVDASSPLGISVNAPLDASGQLYIYFHFAELEELNDGQKRELRIELNGERNLTEPVILEYLKPVTINTTFPPINSERVQFNIYAADDSYLPPILNAVEMYEIIELRRSPTNLDDVHAMMKIKSVYGVKRNWQGDPCLPEEHRWDGVICSYDSSNNPPRIISLNLSWSRLTGEIDPSFASLTAIQYLYLNGNKLTGLVPADLIKKSKNGSLTLSVEGNPDICLSAASCKKNKKIVVPVVASIAAFSVFLITTLVIFWRLKMRKKQATVVLGKSESISENKNDTFAAKKRQFTYSDIVEITKNFETVLGKGGFGTVYHGYLDDTEVAVKLLSSSSAQGYKEFHSEVKLLMRVHHRNLTSLVGYCIEGTHMGIIYEYMAKGSLDQYFSGKHEGKNASILSWEDRMRIAVDAAQGLEYLHDGCKPPIIHRDVKSSNILLNEKLEAKIADFGVSRIFPIESGSHVCTGVVGTPGYLDPEYYSSNRLNKKSDIYSFGVVLLEIITSRPVILTALKNTHIRKWVNSMLAGGDIKSIVDPKLSGDFEINSAWKAVELALSCTSQSSSERPTMIEVVMELKECLALAMTPNGEGHPGNKSKGPKRMLTIDVNADEFSPSAR
ncbi:hypothetical protein LWI29_013310 [Acer saccharum]|uniref:Protein kinase domain-containing protein n=1 Tax=Acer saccharum TaxID=4024 RepID=A0AA39ST05_ACESA|nr:hypothetical protein LWI29_013310 [Acer saccharum]